MPHLTLKPSGLRLALCSLSFPPSKDPEEPPGNGQPAPSAFLCISQRVRPLPTGPPYLALGCCPPPLQPPACCFGEFVLFFIFHRAGPAPLRKAPQALACLCCVPERPCREPEPTEMVGAGRALPRRDTCTQRPRREPGYWEGAGLGGPAWLGWEKVGSQVWGACRSITGETQTRKLLRV